MKDRTPAFRRWFGDSKVVDAQGEPLVVWHGHPQNVDAFFVFDFDRAIDLGMHFGSEEAAFDVIGSTRSSRNAREHVRPFYLSLRNPLVMEDLGDWISSGLGAFRVPALEQLFKMGIVDAAEYKEAYEKVRAVREGPTRVQEVSSRRAALSSIVRDLILDAGYDGIVYTNENEDVGSTAWIAFYPEQIKLADGTNTTFDPKSPDVRLNPAALRKKDFLALLAVPENRKAVEKFVDVVRAYQSDSAGYKSALANRYLALPESVQDAISEPKANLKKLYRGDDGKSRSRATSWTSALDYAKLFGQYVFPYAALASHGGTINTHKLVRLLDFAFEDHDVGDDENEVVILEPVWKNADSDDYLVKNVKGYWFPRENPAPRSRRELECQLDAYGLDDLVRTGSGTLYHGTTRQFQRFDMAYIRHDLIDQFYKAPGIFLTPRWAVAEQYADAARNALLSTGVIADLARKNRGAGEVLARLVHEGRAAWGSLYADAKAAFPDARNGTDALEQMTAGVDPNTLLDIAMHIEGSRYAEAPQEETLFDLWSGAVKSTPAWVFDTLDLAGLDSSEYRPKVYTVEVFGLDRVLVTQSKAKAEAAKAKGYDAVVFCGGADLIDGVPEVVVFNPSKVKVTKVEVVAPATRSDELDDLNSMYNNSD